jgi:GT2 family glycosyltransferase
MPEAVMAECSIVIVTYNGLHEHTIPCLESIFRSTGGEDYEVIVVDNHSSDGTSAYLAELVIREPRLRCILNSTNRGYAGGNNDGIRAASGSVFVLLNNDTQVTAEWLTKLRETLLADRSIGLLGPVSNAVGNEQKIFTSGATPGEILQEGEAWTRCSGGDTFETDRLGFFCVAFRREIIETVGLLDEAYNLGFYEDDDYCLRVQKAGYRLVCREDVFVYHRGSATFEKAPKKTKELLKKNRHLLERKFGIKYSPRHPRERQFDLVESYLQRQIAVGSSTVQQYKIENRLQILNELAPRGLWKRWRYERRLNTIWTYLKINGMDAKT